MSASPTAESPATGQDGCDTDGCVENGVWKSHCQAGLPYQHQAQPCGEGSHSLLHLVSDVGVRVSSRDGGDGWMFPLCMMALGPLGSQCHDGSPALGWGC